MSIALKCRSYLVWLKAKRSYGQVRQFELPNIDDILHLASSPSSLASFTCPVQQSIKRAYNGRIPNSVLCFSCQVFTARPLASTVRSVSVRAYPNFFERKMSTSRAPGENFEVRQTSSTEDWHPDPSKSLHLDKARQALVDDIIALYSCEPTVEQ
jgi:hypothetical protein